MTKVIYQELKNHAPFTFLGTITGILIICIIIYFKIPNTISKNLFNIFHPIHVFFSAMVTTSIYCIHNNNKRNVFKLIIIGYVGSVGIATLSDCIIPFFSEWLLDLPNRGLHIGFISKWWLVNPLAIAGIVVGRNWPTTRFPHMFHVLISSWASLFHMTTSINSEVTLTTFVLITFFLFVAVWLPCCTSDIIFPLLFPSTEEKIQ